MGRITNGLRTERITFVWLCVSSEVRVVDGEVRSVVATIA